MHSSWSSPATRTGGVFIAYYAIYKGHLLMCRNTYGHALQLVLCGGGCGEGDGETLYRKEEKKRKISTRKMLAI